MGSNILASWKAYCGRSPADTKHPWLPAVACAEGGCRNFYDFCEKNGCYWQFFPSAAIDNLWSSRHQPEALLWCVSCRTCLMQVSRIARTASRWHLAHPCSYTGWWEWCTSSTLPPSSCFSERSSDQVFSGSSETSTTQTSTQYRRYALRGAPVWWM